MRLGLLISAGLFGMLMSGSAWSEACGWNDRIWSGLDTAADATTHQQLRFLSGVATGEVQITEFHRGNIIWTADGTHSCSNGIPICRFQFPLTAGGIAGDELGVEYEQFTDDGR